MLLVCWVLVGTGHMPTQDSLGSAKVQSVAFLTMQTSEDQRLRVPGESMQVLFAAPSSVAEGRQELY